MPTRIRLQRKGKKGKPFYHLVIADGRAPRDGKFIEKIGTYDPLSDPAKIDLNFDRALYWLQVGAQPSDTARSILSREGVMLKDHLLKGVKKGALTEDQVDEKFQAWVKEKAEKLEQSSEKLQLTEKELKKQRLEEEKKINQARADELAKKYAKESMKVEDSKVDEAVEAETEAPVAETQEEAPVVETPEAPAVEKKEEAPVAEKKEEAAVETPEAPAEKKEEAPAEETPEAPAEEKKAE